jgi:hypothetical protein
MAGRWLRTHNFEWDKRRRRNIEAAVSAAARHPASSIRLRPQAANSPVDDFRA